MSVYRILVLLLLGVSVLLEPLEAQPIVNTIYGDLQGFHAVDRLDRQYDGFLGVPFAEPPVGNLRWEKSRPPVAWEGIRPATNFSAHCIHQIAPLYKLIGMSPIEDEDCLYLNVYVSGGVDQARTDPLPVMIFYFPGAYILGTAEMYPGEELATNGQVIVVTINFRMGVFGFLTTADSVAPGNYLLWDTKRAIEWVKETITEFGGDPDRITVLGQSSGAMSAGHNILSPETNGLIQGAISISGTPSATNPSKRNAQGLADYYNCSTTDSQEIINCLRQFDAKELDKAASRNNFVNSVVIDGTFVTQRVEDSWEQGVGSDVNYMIGFCNLDSAGFLIGNPIGVPINRTHEMSAEEVHQYLTALHMFYPNTSYIVDTLLARYPDMTSSDPSVCTEALARFTTDSGHGLNAYELLNTRYATQTTGRSYHYIFQHHFSFQIGYPEWVNGSHVDDLYAVLGDPYFLYLRENARTPNLDFNEADRQVADVVQKYYANFAHTGDPSVGPHTVSPPWPAYDQAGKAYMLETPWPVALAIEGDLLAEYNWLLNDYQDLISGIYPNPELSTTAEPGSNGSSRAMPSVWSALLCLFLVMIKL